MSNPELQSTQTPMENVISRAVDDLKSQRLEMIGPDAEVRAKLSADVLALVRSTISQLVANNDMPAVKYLRAHEKYWSEFPRQGPEEAVRKFMDQWYQERKDNKSVDILRAADAFQAAANSVSEQPLKQMAADQLGLILWDALGTAVLTPQGHLPPNLVARALSHPSNMSFLQAIDRQFGDRSIRNKKVVLPATKILAQAASELETQSNSEAATYVRSYQRLMLGLSQLSESPDPDNIQARELLDAWETECLMTPKVAIQAAYRTVSSMASEVSDDKVRNMLAIHLHSIKLDLTSTDDRVREAVASKDNTVLRGFIELFGSAAFKTLDRVRFILDREFPDGAETIDVIEFARLCTLTGPAFYKRVAELKQAHFAMRSTKADFQERKPKPTEDPIRRIQREDEIWNATWRGAYAKASERVKLMAEARRKWAEEGYTPEEIEQMQADVERQIDNRLNDRGEQ